MWKLSWFLHDFPYDTELLNKDEIDDQALVGLQGIVNPQRHRARPLYPASLARRL